MVNERCKKCGSEMVQGARWVRDEKWGRGHEETMPGVWVCPDPKNCRIIELQREAATYKATAQGLLEFQKQDRERIADLERQLEEANKRGLLVRDYYECKMGDSQRLSVIESERDAALAQLEETAKAVVVLRTAMQAAFDKLQWSVAPTEGLGIESRNYAILCDSVNAKATLNFALSNTYPPAQKVKAQWEREALEEAWERTRKVMIDPPWRVDQKDVGDEIRAAILGEKEV